MHPDFGAPGCAAGTAVTPFSPCFRSWATRPYVCHAELNAILNRSSGSLEGAKLYVTLFPCNECAKAIIQSGIKEVVYMSDKYADEANTIASKKMFDMVGIKYRIYEKTGRKLTIEL